MSKPSKSRKLSPDLHPKTTPPAQVPGVDKGDPAVDDVWLEPDSPYPSMGGQCAAILRAEFFNSNATTSRIFEFLKDPNKHCLTKPFTAAYLAVMDDVAVACMQLEPPVTQVDILDYLEWVLNLIASKAKKGLCLVDIPSGEDEERWMEGWLIGYEAGIAVLRENLGHLSDQ